MACRRRASRCCAPLAGPAWATLLRCLPCSSPRSRLQEKGLDTVDANRALGLPDDCREYSAVKHILADLSVSSGAARAGQGAAARQAGLARRPGM